MENDNTPTQPTQGTSVTPPANPMPSTDLGAPKPSGGMGVNPGTASGMGGTGNSAKKWIVAVLVVLVVAGLGTWGALAYMNRTKPLPAMKIGVMGPFSGDSASYPYSILKGAQMAKKDLGADNIELVQEDSQCDAKIAPEAVKKLANQGAVAVIGDNCSGSSLAALPEANKDKIVMISGTASSPKLSIANDYFFRVVPPDQQQGAFLSKLMQDKGYKNVAIFYSDEDYGHNLTSIFTQNFEASGGHVVASVGAARDVVDVATQVTTVSTAKPDAVLLLNNSGTSAVAFIKQYRAKSATTPLYGSDGLYDSSLITSGGTAAEGFIFTAFPAGTQAFQDQFAAQNGDQTQILAAAEGYDAFKAVYLAIKEGGARTGEQVAQKLYTVNFTGVSAPIAFDKYGDVKSTNYKYGLIEIKDGKFVILN